MGKRKIQSTVELQEPLAQQLPVLDIVHHHAVNPQPGVLKAATETITARLSDLLSSVTLDGLWHLEEFTDALVVARTSHRYPSTSEHDKISLHESYFSREEAFLCQWHPDKVPVLEDDGNTWSKALFELHGSDSGATFLSRDTICNDEEYVELNRYCYFCQKLCKESRALNTYVHQEDAAMPRKEPPSDSALLIRTLPSREVREYFDFWPSSADMLSSALNGCHLCAIICHRLVDLVDQGHAGYNLARRASLSSCIGPVKLVVRWSWWHYLMHSGDWNRHARTAVSRSLSLQLPLGKPFEDSDQSSCLLGSRTSMSLDICLSIDATRARSEVFSDLETNDIETADLSTRCNPLLPRKSPALGMGNDHLLSHYTRSEAVLSVANKWLFACHREHSCHQYISGHVSSKRFRPTRLLNVGNSDGTQDPRLNIQGVHSVPVQ